jgi:hypothetical protein
MFTSNYRSRKLKGKYFVIIFALQFYLMCICLIAFGNRNKEQILSDLYERLNSSVDIFGRRLPIAQTVIARIRSSGSGVCGGDGAGSTTLIVCVDCSVLRIFRRAQRLGKTV